MTRRGGAFAVAVTSAVAFGALATPLRANAQEVNFGALDHARPNMVHVKGGAEYAFVAGVGYSRVFALPDRYLVLTGDLTLPIATPDFGDYRARLGVQAPIVGKNRWKLGARVMPTVRGLRTEFNRMTSIGADLGFVGGYYAPRWFVAAELGVDGSMTTYIRHTQRYRDTVFSGAKNGWYRGTGGNFYYGVMGGYSHARVDVILRVGQARDVTTGKAGLIPLFATLGVNVRFGDAQRG